MLKEKKICTVVPCFNEETQILGVIRTTPDSVDNIVIIDDCSTDSTVDTVKFYSGKNSEKVVLLSHQENSGVGASIATGYEWARDNDFDIAVVMAGDGQMDPNDFEAIVTPVADGHVDYSKGNRLIHGDAYRMIPKVRYFGNSTLSLLTKIASGYWHVADSQTGYTAIGREALHAIDWTLMYKRYGQPNDLLVRLNVENFVVRDVPIKPVYNVGEKSGINVRKVVFTISWLLLKKFFWRLKEKYIIRDFHPLIFFYLLAFTLVFSSAALFVRMIYFWIELGYAPQMTTMALFFSIVMMLQSFFFAMLFDMETNKHLR